MTHRSYDDPKDGVPSLTCGLDFRFCRAADKPKLTLDEFFNYVDFTDLKLAPDGQSWRTICWITPCML